MLINNVANIAIKILRKIDPNVIDEISTKIESFAKNIDKAKLAGQIQSYLKGGKEGMFKEKKSEFEYKKDIIKMLLERKQKGL